MANNVNYTMYKIGFVEPVFSNWFNFLEIAQMCEIQQAQRNATVEVENQVRYSRRAQKNTQDVSGLHTSVFFCVPNHNFKKCYSKYASFEVLNS